MNGTDEVTYSTAEVAVLAGVSYRKVDYWERHGAIRATHPGGLGSGSRRAWSSEEASWLMRVGRALSAFESRGLHPSLATIASMWLALEAGQAWELLVTV